MHKEIDFENDIAFTLVTQGGYEQGDPYTYDPEAALFPADVLAFVQKTQPKVWARLSQLDASKAPAMLLESLVKELAAKGALGVLREGFKCVGKTVRLAYFAPNTGLDPASTSRYDDNRLTIVRQVNTKSGAIPDVVLAVNGLLGLAIKRFKNLGEEDQNLLKGQLVSFRNLYGFVSQIVPYQDSDHEKLYTYARFLLTKLPRTTDNRTVQVDDEVELKYYRLQKISDGAIDLEVGEPESLYGPTDVGTGQADEEVQLSTLVGKLNERFGTEFTPADQLFFDQVRETAVTNEQLRQAVMANSMENFEPVFNKQ